jgi:hypothetical protein
VPTADAWQFVSRPLGTGPGSETIPEVVHADRRRAVAGPLILRTHQISAAWRGPVWPQPSTAARPAPCQLSRDPRLVPAGSGSPTHTKAGRAQSFFDRTSQGRGFWRLRRAGPAVARKKSFWSQGGLSGRDRSWSAEPRNDKRHLRWGGGASGQVHPPPQSLTRDPGWMREPRHLDLAG